MLKKAISAIILCLAAVSCGRQAVRDGFTQEELAIICSPDSIMRVLTIEDSTDLTVLRSESRDIPAGSLLSDEYAMLAERMIATVTHPSQDGVGIAGPQVGLNRRVVEGGVGVAGQYDVFIFAAEHCRSKAVKVGSGIGCEQVVVFFWIAGNAHRAAEWAFLIGDAKLEIHAMLLSNASSAYFKIELT